MKKSNNFNPFGTKKVFKNVGVEGKFDPIKTWFGTIQTENGSFLTTYQTHTRSEAVSIFEQEAKVMGGKLDTFVGAFKK